MVDVVVALHPSYLVVPDDVEKLAVPTSYRWSIEDSVVSFEQKAKVEEIHARRAKTAGPILAMEHKTYKPGRHGFGMRGNPDNPLERACLEGTETQVLGWFKRWL